MYSYSELKPALTFGLALLLLLEDILRTNLKTDTAEVVSFTLILLGAIIPKSFIAGAVLYFILKVPSLWDFLFVGVASGSS